MAALPPLIDIGVNLTHRSFEPDRDAVLARAQAAGVTQLIVTGTNLSHSREAAALAAQHPGVLYATAGVHPHDAARCDAAGLAALRELLLRKEVVAVGECGLDFNRNFSPRPVQEAIFAAQIELALAASKPLFLHERDAHPTLLAILDRYRAAGSTGLPVPVVVHCFTGGAQALSDYLTRGFYIGITGWICDERRGGELQQAIERLSREQLSQRPGLPPLIDRLMLETDAPFLMPRDLKPKLAAGRNEPATLRHIAHRVADCMGLDPTHVATRTTDNARRFFGLP